MTACGVRQRSREIGVRMAIGADRPRILRAVVAGPVGHAVIGLAIGVPLALAAGRAIRAQLYGIGSENPILLGAAALVLLSTAVGAGVIPALSAAAIEPTRALRNE